MKGIHNGCIRAESVGDWKNLAEIIVSWRMPRDSYLKCCLRRAKEIVEDISHPGHVLFQLLSSGRHYQSIQGTQTD